MANDINYNHLHKHSGFVISGTDQERITVGDIRDAIASYPDDAEVYFGTCGHGSVLHFYRFKSRGDKILGFELGSDDD